MLSYHILEMTLSEYLKLNSLTDRAFAEKVGRDRATVTRWRNGVAPDWPGMRKILNVTGGLVAPNDFIGIAPDDVRLPKSVSES